MKGEPNERGQTDDRPNLIEKPVAKAWFACKYAAREERGEEEKRRRERRKQRCSQLRHKRPRTHQKRRAPSYDERIQGRPRKRVKRGKREGKKERGRERERRERKVFPATNNRPGTHQRRKGEILSISFRKTPESKERKGEGRGRRGG